MLNKRYYRVFDWKTQDAAFFNKCQSLDGRLLSESRPTVEKNLIQAIMRVYLITSDADIITDDGDE